MKDVRIIANNPEMKDLVELIAEVPFACPDGEQLNMHIVKPMWKPEPGTGFPLVVFIQGSGWDKPNQFRQVPQLSLLARRGCVIASVTHRSRLTAPAPAFLKDVKTALRFLRVHAAEYDIDPERVCAWGTSSGGNTALLLGLTGDDPAFEDGEWPGPSTRVQSVVDCFGPTDLIRMMDVQYKDAPDCFFELGDSRDPAACRAPLAKISPIQYVRSGRELPPFLMLHGDADPVVLYSDTEEMYEKLVDCGYDARLVRITDAPHEGSFWSMELLEIIFRFIQETLQF